MVSNRQLNNRKSGPQKNAVDDHLFAVGGDDVVGEDIVDDVIVGVLIVSATVATVAGKVLAGRRQRRKGAVTLRLVTWLLPSEAR